MSKTELSVIILSYNTRDLTLVAAESAWKEIQTSPTLRQRAELIIVDNQSTDDSVSALRQAFRHQDRVTIFEAPANGGFAAGNNLGIQHSQGEFILLLNSDTIVPPGSLTSLIETMVAQPLSEATAQSEAHRQTVDRLGIVAASLLNQDGTAQPQGGSFPTIWTLLNHWLMLDDIPVIGQWLPSTQNTGKHVRSHSDQGPITKQDWVGGTAMLIRRQVIEEIGLLDEHIFMYGEDIEFCLRAAHHHWDVGVTPRAHIVHLGSASAGSARAIEGEARGYLYIWAKHYPLWQLSLVRWIIKFGCLLRMSLFGTMKAYRSRANVYRRLWQTL